MKGKPEIEQRGIIYDTRPFGLNPAVQLIINAVRDGLNIPLVRAYSTGPGLAVPRSSASLRFRRCDGSLYLLSFDNVTPARLLFVFLFRRNAVYKNDRIKGAIQRFAVKLWHRDTAGIPDGRPLHDICLEDRKPQRSLVAGDLQVGVHGRIDHFQHLAAIDELGIGRNSGGMTGR